MADAPDFIPDDQVPTDAPSSQKAPDFISDEEMGKSAPDFIPDDKYSTPTQQVMSGIEGAARGATFGLSDALAKGMRKGATALGVPDEYLHYVAPDTEELVGRKEANPVTSTISEIGGSLGGVSALPKIGSKAVNMMIQMGLISGGDELSKSILGQGDPATSVVSHIAANGAMGLIGGTALGKVENVGLKVLENTKLGNKLNSFLAGLGHAASFPGESVVDISKSALLPEEIQKMSPSLFNLGQRTFKSIGPAAAAYAGKKYAEAHNQKGWAGAAGGMAMEHIAGKILGPYLSNVSEKYAAPLIAKIAASGTIEGLTEALDHISTSAKGFKQIGNAIESVFSNKALDLQSDEKKREKLKEFITDGGIDQQIREEAQKQSNETPQYAEGGSVQPGTTLKQPNSVAQLWPEQNILMSAAKGRVSGYLNSVRPVDGPKLPYDTKQKDHNKEREYNKALDLANQPLSVLKHIKEGTLLPKHVHAINQMYPELYTHLSQKLQERMAKAELKAEKKPSYKVRQALSLFLGTSLDSTLTPQGIMAAQNVFAQQKAQKAAPQGNTSALKKMGDSMQTAEQSRTQDLSKH